MPVPLQNESLSFFALGTRFSLFLPLDMSIRQRNLTDHGGASSQGCFGPLEEVISRCHPLVGHLEASVDIDPSWDDHPSVSFDGLHASWHNQILPYLPE